MYTLMRLLSCTKKINFRQSSGVPGKLMVYPICILLLTFNHYMKSSSFIQCILQIISTWANPLIFIWGGRTCGEPTLLVKGSWTLQHSDVLSESAEERQLLEKGDIWVTTALTSLTKGKRKNKKGKIIYQTFASNKLTWNGNTLRLIFF